MGLNEQPFSLLPTGNSVPLWSEAFRTYLQVAFQNKGISPSPGNYSFIRRHLDNQLFTDPTYQPVHLRSAQLAPNTFKFDLANTYCEVIDLSPKGWSISPDFDTRFYRPEASWAPPRPVRTTTKLHECLQQSLNLSQTSAKDLSNWLVQALLNQNPPALIITGNDSLEATKQLRMLLDPVSNAILEIPQTAMQLAQLAVTNKVLAFSIYEKITPNKIEAINKIRTGTEVVIKDVSKFRPAVRETLQRPVMLSAKIAPKIHEGQLEIEINEAKDSVFSKLFAALLTAAVRSIQIIPVRAAPIDYPRDISDLEYSPLTPHTEDEGPAP